MSDAVRLRAQKAYSTDPDYLERMALAEEARDGRAPGREAESALASTTADIVRRQSRPKE